MDSNSVFPKWENKSAPMRGTTVRLSEKQSHNLERLVTATGSPSSASAMRLLLDTEYRSMKNGDCSQDDYSQDTDNKPFSFMFRLSEEDREHIAEMVYFYGTKTYSHLISFILNKYAGLLDANGTEVH